MYKSTSIHEIRDELDKKALDFLGEKNLFNIVYLSSFQFPESSDKYGDDLKRFKLLFANGFKAVIWNELTNAIDLDLLNKDDFTASEWRFINAIERGRRGWNAEDKNINSAITTERLILSLPTDKRYDRFEKFFDKNRDEFLNYTGREYFPGDAKPFFVYMTAHLFYLTEKSSKKTVGYIALKRESDFGRTYNLEYFVLPEFRKKGYAYEALTALIKKAFDGDLVELIETEYRYKPKKRRAVFDIIHIKVDHTNTASIALAEKLGFAYDGKIKKYSVDPKTDMYVDRLLYSLEKCPQY